MNLEHLTEHLFNFHKRVIDVMNPIVGFSPTPIRIIVRPLLVGACIPIQNNNEHIYVSSNSKNENFYDKEEIIYKEFNVAHETGHHFNFQNPRNVLEEISQGDNKTSVRQNRIIEYIELAAEFFAYCYFDLDRGIDCLPKKNFEKNSEVHKLYFSITSLDERKGVCRWLITNSYDETKRNYKKGPLNREFRRLVMDCNVL